MGKTDVRIINKAEDLLLYQREYVPEIRLTPEEASLLLGYFEGHDYCIGQMGDVLYRGDLNSGSIEWEPYPLDDVIDICCEWNYELILDIEMGVDASAEPARRQKRYEEYKADEAQLDRLFEITSHGKKINVLAEKIADAVLESIDRGANPTKAAAVAAESIRSFNTDKRGGR